ncbi:MAG TPA: hypothetical protein VL346_01950 [Acidobacteriaceae bacterium]|nr:hypothetical protein [Acidobacteriaceae bacterium]
MSNLESAVRQAAEQQLDQAAIAEGILDKRSRNAQVSLCSLPGGLGLFSSSGQLTRCSGA